MFISLISLPVQCILYCEVKGFNGLIALYTDKPLVDKALMAVVVEDYLPTALDELGLVKGQMVEVMKKMSYGWWKGRTGNAVGIFPSQNVKAIEHQEQQEEVEQEAGHGTHTSVYEN